MIFANCCGCVTGAICLAPAATNSSTSSRRTWSAPIIALATTGDLSPRFNEIGIKERLKAPDQDSQSDLAPRVVDQCL